MNASINNKIIDVIKDSVQDFTILAQNFAKSRFLVLTTEFGQNQEELDALNHLADRIRCNINKTDSGVSLSIEYDDDYEYLNVIQEGMDAPLTGGNNGIVTNPDGSTEQSKVPQTLWGTPLEQYAKEGEDVIGEIRTMLTDLFKDRVQEAVSESKQKITDIVKPYITNELQRGINK